MRVTEPGRERGEPERSARQSAPAGSGPAPAAFSPLHLRALQRSVGNRAVTAMLAGRQEHDHAHEARETHGADETPVQRAAAHSVLRSPGRALESPLRSEMEARLGADFSSVRLHTGPAAQRSATELGARAYTSGEHVVIGSGGSDKHTLAHELTHVIQQRQGPVSGSDSGDGLRVSDPADRFERAAEANATRAMAAPLPDAHGHEHGRHEEGHEEGHEHRGGGAGHASHAGEPAVQRAVGFEFEAQWNVRRMEDDSEDVQKQRAGDRLKLIDAKILDIFLNPHSPYHQRLDGAEQTEVKEGRLDTLRARWFGADGFLNADGEQRLAKLKLKEHERDGLVSTLLIRGEVAEPPLAGENLGKGRVDGLVVRGTRFDLTADASPTGGSNLEWITDPLTSVAQVGTVMDDVTAMASYLDSRRDDRFIPSEEVLAGGGTPQPGLRIYPDKNPLSFAPQATLGARLERLPKLIDYLANRRPMGTLERVPVLGAGRARGRRQASTDLSAGGLGELPAARAGADTAIAALLPTLGFEVTATERKALTGLVMHLAAYLIQGQNLQAGANAKSIAGALMARTDFAHNFSLLAQNLKAHFQGNPAEFTSLVLSAAGMDGGGSAPVFGSQVERGLANDRTRTSITLTRAQWLGGLPAGNDLLKNWDHLTAPEQGMVEQDSAQAVHKSLGALGTQQNLVGPQGDQEAIVAELRRMQDNIPTRQLKPLAIAVFRLVEQLNAEQTLKYPKRE
ncbi:DUF4157 domain-containing protein [Streptomyces sp. NPDC090127]|uniref:eCIS core domain-containing protein n=1 Tax=Streptomyces sp. NPDC090127 TaxID=3365953 RepID=UPI003804C2AA